jgi:putative nucleotidyltransferase with HDIG domain
MPNGDAEGKVDRGVIREMTSFSKAIIGYINNRTSIGRSIGFVFLALLLWLISLLPLMPGKAEHIKSLLAFVAMGAIVFVLTWVLRHYHYHSYLIAVLISALAAPTYILFQQMFLHSEFIFTLVIIGVSARWGRAPGFLSAVLVWLVYGYIAGPYIGKPEIITETLVIGGFFVAAAFIVGTIAQHRESALAARSRALAELEQTYEATLGALTSALDIRDHDTEGHSERVAALALAIAYEMGLEISRRQSLRWGALLHDVGKIGISDNILRKPGPLSETEWEIMRQHPQIGHDMLREIPFLRPFLEIVLYHHEKYNGKGYPIGLKGDSIPLAARIFAVADVYDALTSDRPYRGALSHDEALAEILQQSGQHFDPAVVQAFKMGMNHFDFKGFNQ